MQYLPSSNSRLRQPPARSSDRCVGVFFHFQRRRTALTHSSTPWLLNSLARPPFIFGNFGESRAESDSAGNHAGTIVCTIGFGLVMPKHADLLFLPGSRGTLPPAQGSGGELVFSPTRLAPKGGNGIEFTVPALQEKCLAFRYLCRFFLEAVEM